mgnify:CR=1 FL=1
MTTAFEDAYKQSVKKMTIASNFSKDRQAERKAREPEGPAALARVVAREPEKSAQGR